MPKSICVRGAPPRGQGSFHCGWSLRLGRKDQPSLWMNNSLGGEITTEHFPASSYILSITPGSFFCDRSAQFRKYFRLRSPEGTT